MTTIKVTEARKELYKLLDSVNEDHSEIVIQGKRNNAVLIAEEDWLALQETLYLVSKPGMRESIIEGMNEPVADCKDSLEW